MLPIKDLVWKCTGQGPGNETASAVHRFLQLGYVWWFLFSKFTNRNGALTKFVRGVTADAIFNVETRTDVLSRKVQRHLGDDLPKVVVKAINDTIRPARDHYKRFIQKAYDRPTRFTQNATFTRFANRSNMVGTIYFKDEAAKGNPAGKYLQATIKGGVRDHKGFEKRLIAVGVMRSTEYAIPGSGMRPNAYGNLSRGLYQKVLSAVKAQRDPSQNTTKRSKARKDRAAARAGRSAVRYFAAKRGSHLRPGIYEVRGHKQRLIKPVFIFTSQRPKYRVMLPFKQIAQRRVRREFPKNLKRRAIQGLKL